MNASQGKNHVRWVVALAIAAVAVIYLAVFYDPAQEGDKKPTDSGEVPTVQNDVAPAIQPSEITEPSRELSKDRQYGSDNPLYFRAVFGKEGTGSILGVFDESAGTGTGYDVAYVDENRNGDLTDDAVKKFSRYEQGSEAGKPDPQFNFAGPFGASKSAQYTLDIYGLAFQSSAGAAQDGYHFHWWLNTGDWNYFFINGKARLYSSAEAALQGTPIRLAGDCNWQISSQRKDGKPMISAGLKDGNGCTLRSVRQSSSRLSPKLTLSQSGKVELEKDMEFG